MKRQSTPVKAIRKKCLDCSCWQPKEAKLCSHTECSLYPYRLGKNPNRKGVGSGVDPTYQKTLVESVKTTKDEVL